MRGVSPSPSWKPSQTVHCTICFSPVARLSLPGIGLTFNLSRLLPLGLARSRPLARRCLSSDKGFTIHFPDVACVPIPSPLYQERGRVYDTFRCCYVHRARGTRSGVISCQDCAREAEGVTCMVGKCALAVSESMFACNRMGIRWLH